MKPTLILAATLLALTASGQAQQPAAPSSSKPAAQTIDMTAATPLDRAAYLGQMDKVRYFLKMGALHDGTDVNGNTPIECAIVGGHPDIARFLIDSSSQTERNAELFPAVREDEMTVVQYLLAHGADLNARSRTNHYGDMTWGGGETALIIAASAGHLDMVSFLVNHGADVNAENARYHTALEEAVYEDHEEIVQFLLDHGALASSGQPIGGASVLDRAIGFDNLKMLQALVAHGADINAIGFLDETPLLDAIRDSHPDLNIVQFLLAHGADVNAKDKQGNTALLWAAYGAPLEIVRLLVNHGADVNAKNIQGGTALQHALSEHHQDIVAYLRSHGAH